MKLWFSHLSKQQRIYLITALFIGVAVITVGFVSSPKKEVKREKFDVSMPIKMIAQSLEVTGKSLAREFDLDLNVDKTKSISKYGISQPKLDDVIHHIRSHSSTNFKYYIFVVFVLWGVIFLVRLGRPDNLSEIKDKKIWYPKSIYIGILCLSVGISGFALGKSPNPMEGTVKLFKAMVGLYPDPFQKLLAFIFFVALAVIGNKIICGWACPFGALQELVYSLPFVKKLYRLKPPFWLTNSIRIIFFIITLLFLFGIVGLKKGLVLYHYLNPFNLFNLEIDYLSVWLVIGLSLGLGLFFYRPFCALICPFSFISWIAERFSIFRVRIDYEKCTKCGSCIRACPTQATQGLVSKKIMPADCFSCSRCLSSCPTDAIAYKSIFS